MTPVEQTKSNGQRLFDVLKRIKKQAMVMKPDINMRPSELLMLHSIMACLNQMPNNTGDISSGVTISKLSKVTHQTLSGVSQTVKALEKKELVIRTPSPLDRRHVYVNLSDGGWKIVHQVEREFSDHLDKLTDEFGKEDTEKLILSLEKLAEVLETMKDS